MTKKEAKSMLKYSGFSTEVQDEIFICANNCKRFNSAFKNRKTNPTMFAHIYEDKNKDVTKFEKYNLP
jgi:hypothetical protein